jgi:transcription antitermination factor NusG
MRTLRKWSDRKTWIEHPLFAGYCFARFALRSRLDILNIPGIVSIVGINGPQPIPQEELDALRQAADSQRTCDPHSYLTEGMWVEVVRGPLIGIRGQLVRKAGHDFIVIRVQLLRQAAAVHIDASEVIPAQ